MNYMIFGHPPCGTSLTMKALNPKPLKDISAVFFFFFSACAVLEWSGELTEQCRRTGIHNIT